MSSEEPSILERQFLGDEVSMTDHAIMRSKSRMKKANKRLKMEANRAMFCGRSTEEVDDKLLRRKLEDSCVIHGSVCKIYRGYVYWFQGNRLVTLYPVPNRLSYGQREEPCYAEI